MDLTLLALTIACSGIHCGLKYQHWPMKRTLVVDQKGCQWHTVPILAGICSEGFNSGIKGINDIYYHFTHCKFLFQNICISWGFVV